jgi:hypothetical protein
VFRLKVKCTRGEDGQLINSAVTSSMLTWLPGGSQLPEDSETKLTAFMSKQVRVHALSTNSSSPPESAAPTECAH